MNKHVVLLLLLISVLNTGCQKAPDDGQDAVKLTPVNTAASGSSLTAPASSVSATEPLGKRRVEVKPETKAAEPTHHRQRSASPVRPSPTQLALQLVLREMELQARLADEANEASRQSLSAEIEKNRLERQSLYHVLRKEEQ